MDTATEILTKKQNDKKKKKKQGLLVVSLLDLILTKKTFMFLSYQ